MFRTRFVSIFRSNIQNCKGSHQCVSMRVGWSGPIPLHVLLYQMAAVVFCSFLFVSCYRCISFKSCISLVIYLYAILRMHGTMNIKFIDAKQAKEVHLYQNTKRKLYKTTAAIWYNTYHTHWHTHWWLPLQYLHTTPDDEHAPCPKHVERK